MNDRPRPVETRAEQLRRAFDQTFAEPSPVDDEAWDDLLLVGVGGHPYAVRLLEVAGLFAGRKVRPLPGSASELLGLVGLRGAILPVYDLRLLLGYTAPTPARWLLLAAAAAVALGFDRFDGHRRVRRNAITLVHRTGFAVPHVREVVESDSGVRPLIHVPSVTDAIVTLARPGAQSKE